MHLLFKKFVNSVKVDLGVGTFKRESVLLMVYKNGPYRVGHDLRLVEDKGGSHL